MTCDESLNENRCPNKAVQMKEEDKEAIERTAIQPGRKDQIIHGVWKYEGESVN
jgi:hypothetical protein